MNVRKLVLGSMLGAGLFAGGMIFAQGPEQNINPSRHPNLAAAQNLIVQAYAKIGAAQQANEFDMHGHAAKAQELLVAASRELKAAAEDANRK